MQDLYKIIVVLVGLLFSSWTLFGYFINRWVNATDTSVKELYDRTNRICNEVIEIKATCKERHKK